MIQKKISAENINRRGLMFIISAPSGAGKTTLTKLLLQHDEHLIPSISVTTRPPRLYEQNNVDYIFITTNEFKKMVAKNQFLEYAKVFDNYYGTPKEIVEQNLVKGTDIVFDIDWQGHRQLISTMRDDVTSVYILPPSKDELLKRLVMRENYINDKIKKRLGQVNLEISHWYEYDYIIVNRSIEETVQKLLAILRAERLKKNRRIGLPRFIDTLMKETSSDNLF